MLISRYLQVRSSGLGTCWAENSPSYTTFNARTFLQPQLQKAVRASDQVHFGVISAISRPHISGISRAYLGHISGIWAHLGHISGEQGRQESEGFHRLHV